MRGRRKRSVLTSLSVQPSRLGRVRNRLVCLTARLDDRPAGVGFVFGVAGGSRFVV